MEESHGKKESDGVSDTDAPSQLEKRVADVLEKDISRRESAIIDDEAAVLSREKSATAREEAADLREDAAHLREGAAQAREGGAQEREGAATAREQEIPEAEAQAASSDQILAMLRQANAHLITSSIEAHKLTEQVQIAHDKLEHLVHHDVLTNLPNRTLLQDRLTQAIELALRQHRQLAVLFIDLDQFKHINDSLGHLVGDRLLQSVAQRLLGGVRHSDTVSRQGGDEFVLLLPHIEQPEDMARSAKKLIAELALPHLIDGHNLYIGASIGISIYPNDGQDAETLIKCADSAMYHAKENGRNNYQFFEQAMNIRAVERQSIESGLRRALELQEFVLHYQPKIDLQSGGIVGVEALIRWQHPQRGLLSPMQFVPIAEECGLMLPIGRWVLGEACRQAQLWLQAGLPPITVAINISAPEFHAQGFFQNVRATLEETHLQPRYLELELTESVLMRDASATGSMLHALVELGVKLAVDDFGTGYSSLSYLRKFPIDTLKIDQSFVNDMTHNPDAAAIVCAVISMAKSLRLRVIAEGVETAEQATFLLARQCEEGQGYHFGRPVVAEVLAALLKTGT